jgi:putative spermidine/putrescine transport system substrate-binding protein
MLQRRMLLAAGLLAATGPAALAQDSSVKGEITVVIYSGVFEENYTKAVIEPFRKKFPGVKVNIFPGRTSAQTLGMVRSQKGDPQTDVVLFDVTTAQIGAREELFLPLAEAEVPNLKELLPSATPAAIKANGAAVTFDHLVIVYNSEKIAPAPTTLKSFWDPKFKGQLGINAPPNIIGLGLTMMATKMAGGDWTKSIDPGVKALAELAPSVATFDPNPDGYTMIMGGQLVASTGWNARAQFFHDQSKGKLGVLLPAEGSVFQINTINVTRGTKNRAAAMAFANYALSAEAQAAFTELMFYAPVNAKAVGMISPKALGRTAASKENFEKMIPVDWGEIVKVRDAWNNRWRREIVSASGR